MSTYAGFAEHVRLKRVYEFRRRYTAELRRLAPELEELRELARHDAVTLTFSVRNEGRNDAVVLSARPFCDRRPKRPRENCCHVMERKVPNRMYPTATRELAQQRRELAPAQQAAFDAFGKAVFANGALPAKMKQIIAVAVAHVTQCPYCIKGHTKAARRAGATPQELMEAIWIAAEMRAGGAYAHASLMLDTLNAEPD